MRYARILSAIAGTAWAIHPEKARAIMSFLAFAAAGGRRTADELADITRDRTPDANATVMIRADDDDVIHRNRERKTAAQQAAPSGEGQVIAVVGLKGVISPRLSDEMDMSGPGGTSAEGFTKRLKAALADPRVGGVIIDVDSPGGAVNGVPEAAAALYETRKGGKPVVAVASPWCASAAYWIASQAPEFVVLASGEVGSIGVYTWHEDLSKALDEKGIKVSLIKSEISPNKAETHPAFPLADETREHLQGAVDYHGKAFVDAVARGRGVKASDVIEKFGGGRMIVGTEAVALGMADRVGSLDDEIRRMAERLAPAPKAKGKSALAAHRRRAALW